MGKQHGTTIADLEAGERLCCLYASEEERRAALIPFLRQGLERGEQVLYIAGDRESFLRYLREDGLEPEPYLVRGQLAFLLGGNG